jgi:heme A synthase
VQIALGILIGERHAALACSHFLDCALWPAGVNGSVFDPFRTNEGLNEASLQALHRAHLFGAAAVALVLAWTALLHARIPAGQWFHGVALLLLTGTQLALGAAGLLTGLPIMLVVAHNFVAALLVAVLLDAVLRLSAREAR